MRLGWDDKALIRHLLGVVFILCLCQRFGIVRIPHIRESLVEQQREDVLLVIARVHQSAQDGRRAPQVGFEFGLGQAVSHVSAIHSPEYQIHWQGAPNLKGVHR